MKNFPILLVLVSAGALAGGIPATASTANARVGTLESLDGTVTINGTTVQKQGQLPVLGRNDALQTGDGHAEVILTPGVFLRLGKNTEARLLNDSITDTQVGLDRGSAILEVDELHQGNHMQVNMDGASAVVLKTGLYRFDSAPSTIEVIKGKAEIQDEDSHVTAKGHKQVALGAQLVETKVKQEANDDLAQWSRLRAQYESEASVASAQYIFDMGWGWGYSNWFWNPWFGMWTWLPGGPYFMNPYGLYFWNPGLVYRYYPYRTYGVYGRSYPHSAFLANPGGVRPYTPGRNVVAPARLTPAPTAHNGFGSVRSFGGFSGARSFGGRR